MHCNFLVYEENTGRKLRFKQAERKAAEGNIVWVEYGKTWRTATLHDLQTIISARNEQSRLRAPIAMAEIPGIKVSGIPQDFHLIHEANQFAANA